MVNIGEADALEISLIPRYRELFTLEHTSVSFPDFGGKNLTFIVVGRLENAMPGQQFHRRPI
jgi:hypothetical protein